MSADVKNGPNITVLGDINIDAWFLVRALPAWDAVTHTDRTMLVAGGKGLNMALGAGRLGGQVRLLSVLGDDIWGQTLMKQVEELLRRLDVSECVPGEAAHVVGEVSLSYIIKVAASTPVCGVLTNYAVRSPAFLGTKGLSHWNGVRITPEWRDAIAGSDVLLTCLEPPIDVVQEAVSIARDAGALVVLNPGPPPRTAVEYQELSDMLSNVDVLVPNDYEARRLVALGDGASDNLGFEAITDRLQDVISQDRVALVCVTQGRAGFDAVYYAEEQSKSRRRRLKGKVGPITTDPVGQGDAFACALAVELAKDRTIPYSLRFAAGASSVAVRTAGAAAAMPSLHDVHATLQGRLPEVIELGDDT